jgi:hypothetical protein
VHITDERRRTEIDEISKALSVSPQRSDAVAVFKQPAGNTVPDVACRSGHYIGSFVFHFEFFFLGMIFLAGNSLQGRLSPSKRCGSCQEFRILANRERKAVRQTLTANDCRTSDREQVRLQGIAAGTSEVGRRSVR